MEGGYPWEIDDTRSHYETPTTNRRSPPPHSEADYDMEEPHAPFIPGLNTQAAGEQKISTVQSPTYKKILLALAA